ncbi:unnamed protein product [Arabis nemorensis]|uniref:Coatomer subunit gamma n=1 Tax=Arabis nemorensis TaxID=586526 RepID=A0A565CB37_9BRAS|nr:unnamed protein product [Arabis nemorensis]
MVYLILTPSPDEDMKIDMYRANAIRVLCRIIDGSLLTLIERRLKEAVVDKNPVVLSAAFFSGLHMLKTNPEIVKRWTKEVEQAVQSRAALVQFHALALLHQSCLRHKAEMVILEAARAITELDGVTSRELTPAITVLQLFLSSPKPVLRFAAVRTLNKVAMTHPMAVTNCNIDMESLISDQNRSIATLAITTLLKTGNESSVERLIKQITNFMSDIADEFKIVVVDAIRLLCLKFPLKYRSLMNFLSNTLREEGGFEYKRAIVDSIVTIIRDIPDAKENGLLHLCEFIEDCEFTYLSTQNATVRAAAVCTLAKFGFMVEALKVRDRVTLFLSTLGNDGLVDTDKDSKAFLFGSLDAPVFNMETIFFPCGAETEYAVNVVKHIFDNDVVFQYNCTNTVPEQLLERVMSMIYQLEATERLFSLTVPILPCFAGQCHCRCFRSRELSSKPIISLPYDSPGQAFVAFEKPEGAPAIGKFSNTLTFIVKEVDANTGEPNDDG